GEEGLGLRAGEQARGIRGATLSGEHALRAVPGQRLQQLLAILGRADIHQQAPAVAVAHLADRRLDARVDARDVHHVRATVGRAPDADLVRVHLGLRLQVGDGVADVLHLLERLDAPLRSFTAVEAAVVEGQADE